jgi:hypothetical protein
MLHRKINSIDRDHVVAGALFTVEFMMDKQQILLGDKSLEKSLPKWGRVIHDMAAKGMSRIGGQIPLVRDNIEKIFLFRMNHVNNALDVKPVNTATSISGIRYNGVAAYDAVCDLAGDFLVTNNGHADESSIAEETMIQGM